MIFLILFTIVLAFLAYKYWKYRLVYDKDLHDMKSYDGEYWDDLMDGMEYLEKNYPIKNVMLQIYTGPNRDRDSYAGRDGWFLRPKIILNERQIEDASWRRDFNVSALVWGLPLAQDVHDFAFILLAHEYRHLMQEAGKVTDAHFLPPTPENVKMVLPYRLLPNESDADWFAYDNLKRWREHGL